MVDFEAHEELVLKSVSKLLKKNPNGVTADKIISAIHEGCSLPTMTKCALISLEIYGFIDKSVFTDSETGEEVIMYSFTEEGKKQAAAIQED